MADTLTIGLIQHEIIPHDPAGNLLGVLNMLEACVSQNVNLFVLTELWSTGLVDPTDQSSASLSDSISGPTMEALKDFCIRNSTNLLAGSIPLREKDKLTNTSLMINRAGEIVLKYSKIQLFKPMGEDLVFAPGNSLSAVEIDGVGVGVLICYDIRFPLLARNLAHSGCEVIIVPALWPESRIRQWEILLRARAAENQIYIVGANGLANQNGVFFPGHSVIVGPTGDAANSPEMRESAIIRTLDIKKLRELRTSICYLDEEKTVTEVNWNVRE
jgi:omega-amidase